MKNCGDTSKAILRHANKNKTSHSTFESFHHVLMKIRVIANVKINISIENILSKKNVHQKGVLHSHSAIQLVFSIAKGFEITEDIHAIPSILNISDQITFPTHISYFFLIIAANVAAISGKLVPAAIMVAPIAHCDIQSCSATNTAESTMTSADITSSQILAMSFVIFSHILFFSASPFLFFIIIEMANSTKTMAIKIGEYNDENHRSMWNQFSVFIFINDKARTHTNTKIKFFIFGNSLHSLSSSSTGSFLIHRYQLYPTNNASNVAHSHQVTVWSHKNTNNNVVTHIKNNQSLLTIFFFIKIGATIALSHSINHRLKIFDPTTFPTDNDQFPLSADIADKNNSGAEVQIAKIVKPINNGDNLKNLAILTLELISLSAANHSSHNQKTNNIIANTILKL